MNYTPDDAFGLLRSYSRHRDFVRLALLHVIHDIERRSLTHDASKMLDDEFAGFARINAAARVHKFGSEEYQTSMDRERPTIDLHFSRNSHHPERPKLLGDAAERERGLPDDATYWAARDAARMTFLDVIEMVCDWWGARKGYDDPRPWAESVELNFKSKGALLSKEQLWLAREVAAFLGSMESQPQKAGMSSERKIAVDRPAAEPSAEPETPLLELDIWRIAEYARTYGGDAVEDAADRVIIALDGGIQQILRKADPPATETPIQRDAAIEAIRTRLEQAQLRGAASVEKLYGLFRENGWDPASATFFAHALDDVHALLEAVAPETPAR